MVTSVKQPLIFKNQYFEIQNIHNFNSKLSNHLPLVVNILKLQMFILTVN